MSETERTKEKILGPGSWSWIKKITILVFCVTLFHGGDVQAEPPLKLGIHPHLSSTEIIRRFSPLADYLSRALKRPVTIEIANSYATHIQNIATDNLDAALLGPASYVLMTAQRGRRPLLAVFESNRTKTLSADRFTEDAF
jgi:ABC-type phosphate/phosphonate transport system substrate-binding protein